GENAVIMFALDSDYLHGSRATDSVVAFRISMSRNGIWLQSKQRSVKVPARGQKMSCCASPGHATSGTKDATRVEHLLKNTCASNASSSCRTSWRARFFDFIRFVRGAMRTPDELIASLH